MANRLLTKAEMAEIFNLVAIKMNGFFAGIHSNPIMSNPHDPATLEGRHWIDGWVEGVIAEREIDKE